MVYSFRNCHAVLALVLFLALTPSTCGFSINNSHRLLSTASSSRLEMAATSTNNNDKEGTISTRRAFVNTLTLLLTTTTTTAALPLISNADDSSEAPTNRKKGKPLESCLYTILRVREATEQESRLIKSGKFKDVQRANIKLAVRFMLNNYRLADNFIAASAYLEGNKRIEAGNVGQTAVQSLYTILEYFDAADVQNLKVGSSSLAGKDAIVLQGLDSVRRDIDQFLSYFPSDVLEGQKALIKEENDLNEKEFDTSLGAIINLTPVKN